MPSASPESTSTEPSPPILAQSKPSPLKSTASESSLPTIRTPRSPKPELPALKTPRSAPLPSELPRSPAPGLLDVIKQEEDTKTPITPPTAYTDFLKALSPAISSPGGSRSPSFSDRSSPRSTPTTQPSSAGSSCLSCTYDPNKPASASMVPPSPFVRPPNSARTPTALRKLRIPQSPAYSPATDSPKSSAIRSPFSPADRVLDGKTRYYGSPRSARSGCHRPVSVRQVVTRTVTYTRSPVTPLEPAPKGKRRKLE
ncbi:MAG: hypothetical protein HETSPECPRED_006081 [Heterodermia speciosa]|uniref:Uncharacterized protein n=1 Tax=Heterodermia speciosa TaxID=116794 RepID=A0A8H3EGM3_9LECA|nr:MAG: hypothetical protein HETSPECPRED_006081 [Heterodermia speciosa]